MVPLRDPLVGNIRGTLQMLFGADGGKGAGQSGLRNRTRSLLLVFEIAIAVLWARNQKTC